ncbi:hypothetical protein O6H91_21G012400 [Diphasiastrum complanatum]|uniref:Uncharacterized protein n=1 Tax=Diphasiastrum complanatum TaxID=34168 RepID=A0ACC2AI40_DIPCM|nr:hypothetical protein O6H91_21G012400 [Diphasiastrum complanatum]
MAERAKMLSAHLLHVAAGASVSGQGESRCNASIFGSQARSPSMLGQRPVMMAPPPAFVEQKLRMQQAEMQRLVAENQRLAATHVGLRQELALKQQQVQQFQQAMAGIQTRNEGKIMNLMEKASKLEAELRLMEPLKPELQQMRGEAEKLSTRNQELMFQIQQLTIELQRVHRTDTQQYAVIQTQNQCLRQELQLARATYIMDRKAINEREEQKLTMEKTLVTLMREVETLRAQLMNEKLVHHGHQVGTYNMGYNGSDYSLAPLSKHARTDVYGVHQLPALSEKGVRYSAGGPAPAFGPADITGNGTAHVPA